MMLKKCALVVFAAVFVGGCHHHVTKEPMAMSPTAFDEGYHDGCISSRLYDKKGLTKDFDRAKNDQGYSKGFDAGFTDCGFSTPRKHAKHFD